MATSALAEITDTSTYDVVSTDLFDTILMRDRTTETQRLARAGRRAATELGLDPEVLVGLRWTFQSTAYRAVAIERPMGEAALIAIARAMAAALGLGEEAAQSIRRAEVEVDAEHLRPNRELLGILQRIRDVGVRVIAVSDTYYSEADLRQLLTRVVGVHPITAVYSSADLGSTKHAGGIFAEVSSREGVSAQRVLHMGDSVVADMTMATAAGWSAVHLPRSRAFRIGRRIGGLNSLPTVLRRRAQ